jgi:hypothetical protein
MMIAAKIKNGMHCPYFPAQRSLKKWKTGFRVRIEDFFGNNSYRAKRPQIRLFERKRVSNLQ